MTRVRLVVLAVIVLLAGCADIPDSSVPVVVGPAPTGDSGSSDQELIKPEGPTEGASIDQMVRDFLKALTATDAELEVARQYLTPEEAEQWKPSGEVTVISPAQSAQVGGKEGTVNFNADQVATIDDDGTYHVASGKLSYEFNLVEVGGEWRITNPPDTLWISSSVFDTVYDQVSLYFGNPAGTKVVPDLRHFRERGQQLANRLVRELIAGPSSLLKGGIRNELTDNVELLSAIQLDADVVTVDLSGLDDKSEQQLKVLAAQLAWTLDGAGISQFRITNDGDPVEVDGIGDVVLISDFTAQNPDAMPSITAYYLSSGALHTADAQPVPGPAGAGAYAISDAAVALDGARLAAISAGTSPPVLRAGAINAELSVIDVPGATSLASPTWGPSESEFWVVRNGSDIVRAGPELAATTVDTSSIAGIGDIKRIAMSRDGTRLAIIAAQPTESSLLYVAAVIRDGDSVSLGPPVQTAYQLDVSAVAWNDARQLAILARTSPTSAVLPYVVAVDDSASEALEAPYLQEGEPVAIASAPGQPLLIAGNSTLQRYEGSTWVGLIGGQVVNGSKPFYPG